MVRRKLILAAMMLLMMSGICSAESWDLDVSAGSKTLTGGVHYKTYVDTGYMRFGGSGVYTDDDNTEFKWGSLDFFVGSDTLLPGLTCEVGLRGILGTAKDLNRYSSDVGAIGFALSAGYLFSRDMTYIPLEIFGGLTWAPDPMTFRDTDSYREINLGVGVRIIQNASITFSYTNYHLEMEAGPGDWNLDHDSYRLGLVMRF